MGILLNYIKPARRVSGFFISAFFISGVLISGVLIFSLSSCMVQNKVINPVVPEKMINQNLPIFINGPAIYVQAARSDLSVPQNLYLIIRDGHVLSRYESVQGFDQIFNVALNQAILSMQFQESNNSPYVLKTNIDFLKINDASHSGSADLLQGKLVASYSLKLNGVLIWSGHFESHATMPYQTIQDEGQAVSGVIQALIGNNLGQFGQGLNHACLIKPQGINC